MQTLLEWAVENIVEWGDEWDHLRYSADEVLFTSGIGWYQCALSGGVWSTEEYSSSCSTVVEVCLNLDGHTITKQQWLDAKGEATKASVLKLSLEEVLEPLLDVTQGDYVFNLAKELGINATEPVTLSTHGILKLFDVYVKAYISEVYSQLDPNTLLQEIATKKKELAELESKLKESKRG